MFVDTPRMRNSATARRARPTAVGEVPAPAGELDQHRVEVRADLRTGVGGAAVEADAGAAGRAVGADHAGVRAEAVGRVLGGDAALERGAAQRDGLLGQAEVGERLAGGDAQLRLHEVDVGDLLGDRVLDLDARVHLDEDVVAVAVEQELDGARVAVADVPGEPHGVGADPLAQLRVEVRRGRDLDDLLVAALHRAVALEQVDHVAVRRRRGSAPRCAAARRRPARGTRSGRRTRTRPRAWRPRSTRAARRGPRRGACRGRHRRRRP